jgi:hypothetical protein
MKASKIALSVFFALALAVVCLVAAISVDGLTVPGEGFNDSTVWYAVGGFVMGLVAGVFILKYLSPKTLSISSIALGSLAFIALAILFYFYYQGKKEEDNSGSAKPTGFVVSRPTRKQG